MHLPQPAPIYMFELENTMTSFDNKVPFHDIQFQNLTPISIT